MVCLKVYWSRNQLSIKYEMLFKSGPKHNCLYLILPKFFCFKALMSSKR